MNSRTAQSAKNMASGFLYQFVMLILQFISRTVFIRTLGKEYLGLNGIFSDVLSLLCLADLGFGTAMAYTFYKPLANNDEKQIASLIGFYKKIYNIIAMAITVIGICILPFIKHIIKTEHEIPYLPVLYLISLAGVIISYLFVYKTTLLTAAQMNYKVTNVNTIMNLSKTIVQILILFFLKNYIVYLLVGLFFQFMSNLIATKITEKSFPYITDKKNVENVDDEVKRDIYANLKSVFLYKISSTLFNATDNLLISIIVGTAMVGVYSNYLMVSNKLLLLEQIVFGAMVASIGNIIASDSSQKKYSVFQATQSASFIFSGIIVSVFCIMANDFVRVWLGSEFELSYATILAVTLNTYLSCVLQPLWIYRDAAGLYLKTKNIMFFGAITNIILSVILGKIWGIFGIIIASAIARLVSYFWYEPRILFQEYFEQKTRGYFLAILFNLILVIATILGLQALTSGITVSGWTSLIEKGLIIGIVCTLIFMFAYHRTEGYLTVKSKVINLIKAIFRRAK